MRCRDEGIIPLSLRIKPLVSTKEGYRIAERASKAFVHERVRHTYRMKKDLHEKSIQLEESLSHTLEPANFVEICSLTKKAASHTFHQTKCNNLKKLEKLNKLKKSETKFGNGLKPDWLRRWVVNLSDQLISKEQEEVLSLGLNFVPVPKTVSFTDTIAAIEEGTRDLPPEEAEELRSRSCGILRRAKPSKDNLTKELRKALKHLKENNTLLILPAEKGNATVLMKKYDYEGKMRDLLDSDTYSKIKKDPTKTQEAKFTKIPKGLEKKGDLLSELYYKIKPTGAKPPRMYGLPKIHKKEIPLRPIVASIDCPSYYLSKHLATLIAPLVGNTLLLLKTLGILSILLPTI
jgi:hypothetical protein